MKKTKARRDPAWFQFLSGPTHGSSLSGTLCGLCGQSGIIDTTGVRTPAGVEVGGLFYCICPNGRVRRRNMIRGSQSARVPGCDSGRYSEPS